MLKRILWYITNPGQAIKPLGHRGLFNWIPDKVYLPIIYLGEMNRKLNLKTPMLFTEKLQWLKLHNRKKDYSTFVDKYKVRKYVGDKIGEDYLIPLLGVYDNEEEIEWETLPDKFVIKCNHGSGTNILCRTKSKLNIRESKRKLHFWMKQNWYNFGREWPYKNIKKKIIIEKFLGDPNFGNPNDYKFWVFNGEVKYINVHFEINNETYINIYNSNWELQNFCLGKNSHKNNLKTHHERPVNLEKMINLSEILGKGLPFVRIDFYEVNEKIFFGEITFYPSSGFIQFRPNQIELDKMYGNMIDLYIES